MKGKKGFEPGKSGNPYGRKNGIPNRTTREARELLEQILFGEVDNIKSALKTVFEKDPSRFLDACSKLFTYVLPKKSDITSDGDKIILPTIDFTKLTDEETKEFVRLKNKAKQENEL